MTFIMHPQIVLREADIAELILGAPGAGQRRLLLVHGRVEALEAPLQLLLLLVEGRVAVREGRRGAADSVAASAAAVAEAAAARTSLLACSLCLSLSLSPHLPSPFFLPSLSPPPQTD